MTMCKRLFGLGAAVLLACSLLAGTAFAADGSVSLGIRCGESGQSLKVPDVPNDAHSLQLDITVQCSGSSASKVLKDISFSTASGPRNLKVDEARTTASGGTVQLTVVLSAGSDELFPGSTGNVDLGTLSMKSTGNTVKASVTVASVQSLDGRYTSVIREDVARAQLTVGKDGIQEAATSNPPAENPKKSNGSKKPNGSGGSDDPGESGGFDPSNEPLYTDGGGEGDGDADAEDEAEGEGEDEDDGDNRLAKRVGQSKVAREAGADEFPLGAVILGSVIGLALIAAIIGAIVYARNRKR